MARSTPTLRAKKYKKAVNGLYGAIHRIEPFRVSAETRGSRTLGTEAVRVVLIGPTDDTGRYLPGYSADDPTADGAWLRLIDELTAELRSRFARKAGA